MALDEAQIRENCKRVQSRISEACARWRKSGDTVDLMAVTKTVPPELVNVRRTYSGYSAGYGSSSCGAGSYGFRGGGFAARKPVPALKKTWRR